jgi:hypothetical protein
MSDIKQREYDFKILDFSGKFSGPASADDYDRLVGKPNACVSAAMQQYCFHDRGPEAKAKFAEKLEAYLANHAPEGTTPETRAFRMEKSKKDGEPDRKVYTESEKKFYDRVFAAGLIPKEDAEAIFEEVNTDLGDWAAAKVSARKPGEEYFKQARPVFARATASEANKEAFLNKAAANLGQHFETVFGELNLDNVARYIKELTDRAAEKAKREAQASLGFEDDSSESSDEETE